MNATAFPVIPERLFLLAEIQIHSNHPPTENKMGQHAPKHDFFVSPRG
jgi:hypothetical protein